jgi:hypothetical protein
MKKIGREYNDVEEKRQKGYFRNYITACLNFEAYIC